MENSPNPIQQPHTPPKQPQPKTPNEGQNVQPSKPDTEINPAKPGNNTEVDLDKSKVKTYPDKTPPERH